MAYDWLKGVADEYDVIVIGSGLGGLTGANVLAKAGHLRLPQHVDFVLGVPGGLDATVDHLVACVRDLPPGCTWSVAGIGRAQLPLAVTAIAMGGHVRVGLEDNMAYYSETAFAGFKNTIAFQPRDIKQNRGSPSEGIWIIKLLSGDFEEHDTFFKVKEANGNRVEKHPVSVAGLARGPRLGVPRALVCVRPVSRVLCSW